MSIGDVISKQESINLLKETDSKEEENSLDDIINSTGRGTWTYIYFMIACTSISYEIVNLFGPVFQVPKLDFECNETLNYNEDVMPINGTECLVWRRAPTTSATFEESPCKSFVYDKTTYQSTLTEEFDLVCSKSNHKEFYKSAYLVGCVLGCLLGGMLSDKFGRKPVLWYSSLLMTILTFLLMVVPMYDLVVLIRFLMGITTIVVTTTAYTIAIETTPNSLRSVFSIAVALPFGMTVSVLALVAYLTRKWRDIQTLSSIPLFILVVLSNPYLVEESPRWLVEKGKLAEAERVIRKAARMNGNCHQLSPYLRKDLERNYEETKSTEFETAFPESESVVKCLKSLVSTAPMLKLTAIMCTLWFCQGCVYIVIPYKSNDFQSPFMFLGVLGFFEWPCDLTILPLALKLSRKVCISLSYFLLSIILITMGALEAFHVHLEWLEFTISTIGYTLTSTLYTMNLVFCAELYPTSVRSSGLSTTQIFENIGFNLPVVLNFLIPPDLSWMSLIIIGLLALSSSVAVIFLPESKDKPLLQTVDEYVRENGAKKKTYQLHTNFCE